MFFALEFPSIDHLVKWPSLGLKGTPFEINKTVLLTWLAVVIVLGLFWVASRSAALVPKGVQNIVEAGVDFVRTDVIQQTIGAEGMGWFAP